MSWQTWLELVAAIAVGIMIARYVYDSVRPRLLLWWWRFLQGPAELGQPGRDVDGYVDPEEKERADREAEERRKGGGE